MEDTKSIFAQTGEAKAARDMEPLTSVSCDDPDMKHMALYEEEFSAGRPMLSRLLSTMGNYEGGMMQNQSSRGKEEDDEQQKEEKSGSKLGTILGVYFPCIQNIFGVILFIRLVWVVGSAGIIEAFLIVFICCCTTMTTAISMSAIATNGVVSGGGSYFMISRALGPEFGGAVGILFYLGTSFASSMYIVGAVEILLIYMVPAMAIFRPLSNYSNVFNNYRVYGSILLLIMFVWVFLGVKFVSKFSPIALFCVILSIISIYVGIFVANPESGPKVCLIGERIINSGVYKHGSCNESTFEEIYCPRNEDYELLNPMDPDCHYFQNNPVQYVAGIPGLSSGVVTENLMNKYTLTGDRVGERNKQGDRDKGEVVADIASTFVLLLAIFFPSCTGIMAGSNRSGDLADASRSIPTGTIAAIATTSFVYLSCVVFFGATIEGQLLRDKFGESIDGGLVVARLAWPNEWVILVGSFLSTIGAGLQSLTGAPRLLQAIAADGVIPFLNLFSVTTARGEPLRALLLTACISEIGIIIASLDYIAPIITMFFLMCYGFVNLACAVQTLLKTPNWRPRFKFYHWGLSIFGLVLCIVLMFISSWYYALVAISIAAGIYKYIEYKGAEKEWGDGIRGLAMSAARYALHRLEAGPPHVKNWRPQILLFLKLDDNLQPKHRKLLTLIQQLKAGKGLTLVGSVVEGDYCEKVAEAEAAHQCVMAAMKKERVKGFSEVLVSTDITQGLNHLVQTCGVGGLRHNTVMMGWPQGWKDETDHKNYKSFIDTVRNVSEGHLAMLIPKGIEKFPECNEKMKGYIDIWWIVHDGGLLMLLPFLLIQHKVWKNCKMRIFTVAQIQDNNVQLKNDLVKFLYQLRMNAEVHVVEMPDSDISEYTYERTLRMEQRNEMVKELRKNMDKLKSKTAAPQLIVDSAHRDSLSEPSDNVSSAEKPDIEIKIETSCDDVITTDKQELVQETQTPSITVEESGDNKALENDVSVCNDSNNVSGNDCKAIPDTQNDVQSASQSASQTTSQPTITTQSSLGANLLNVNKPDDTNVRRMHTAIRLNAVILEKSSDAQLVIVNLPGPPKNRNSEQNYMEFLEVLTEGLDRVLMVRGGGREVVTIYS